jgi:hypothetical protein
LVSIGYAENSWPILRAMRGDRAAVLWNMMSTFVDLAWGADSVQSAGSGVP